MIAVFLRLIPGQIVWYFLHRRTVALATLDACFFCSEMPYTRPPLLSMLGHTHDAVRRRDATRSLLGFMTSAGPLGDNAKSQQKCSHFFQLQFKICCVSNNISKGFDMI